MAEVKLMKGNEVLAEAAIRCGCDAYYEIGRASCRERV